MGKKKSSKDSKEEKVDQKTKRFYDMPVESIMDLRLWDLPLIEKTDTALHLMAILSSSDHVWVVDNLENRYLEGVITEHDILHIMSPSKKVSFFGLHSRRTHRLEINETVEHIMQYHPVTCETSTPIKDVLKMMSVHGCRRIAVVKGNSDKIVGEITLHQIIAKVYVAIKPVYKALCAKWEMEKRRKNGSE